MTSTDLFQRRANECRRLAAAARKGSDRAFWLGLGERWQTLESQSARRYPRETKSGSERFARAQPRLGR
jgi:hypothetical protein